MKNRVKIVLDTRKKRSTGKFPVKIRVSFHSNEKYDYHYFDTGESMFKEEFKKLLSMPVAEKLLRLQKECDSILTSKPYITNNEFRLLFNNGGNYQSVQGLFEIMRIKAKANGQVKSYGLYGNTSASITKFVIHEAMQNGYVSDGNLVLAELTPTLLTKYENWMAECGRSYNTIGIYTRNIATLCNMAIEMGLMMKEQYPFGRGRYTPPSEVTKKRPMSLTQKDLFMNYVAKDENTRRYHDFCKLSLYCFGRNFSDIARWRWKNIENNIIKSYRTKTVRTRRVKEKIITPITPEIQEIITRHGTKSLDPDAFIFDILKPGMDAFQERYRIDEWIANTNSALKIICDDLGIPKITTMTLRYTFAYIMKKHDVPISKAQGMMGHESSKTTEIYWKSIEMDEIMEVAKLIYLKAE